MEFGLIQLPSLQSVCNSPLFLQHPGYNNFKNKLCICMLNLDLQKSFLVDEFLSAYPLKIYSRQWTYYLFYYSAAPAIDMLLWFQMNKLGFKYPEVMERLLKKYLSVFSVREGLFLEENFQIYLALDQFISLGIRLNKVVTTRIPKPESVELWHQMKLDLD